jgi:hypothetical protein
MASGVKKMMYAVVLQLYQLKAGGVVRTWFSTLIENFKLDGGAVSLLPPSRRPT